MPDLLSSIESRERRLVRWLPEPSSAANPSEAGPSWAPQAGPQTEAYNSEAFETLYGGAAGGGKSDLLLGLALLRHHSVLLLRRTYLQLEDSLIKRSKEFYRGLRYNGSQYVWRGDSGQHIRFGHLERDDSVYEYQSAQFDMIGFDELTQFTRPQYEYMLSRARTTRGGQRVRIVACTNPGGEGNDWVMERWAPWLDETHPNPARSGEVRYFRRADGDREVETTRDDPRALGRTFIAARLTDNRYIDADYELRLSLMPDPFRSQLRDGSWTAGLVDDAYQVIPRAWVKAAQARWHETRPDGPLSCVGVDVARGGQDKTVKAKRYGIWYAPLEKRAGAMTRYGSDVAALVESDPDVQRDTPVNVDVIGVGASAYDSLRERQLNATGVNFAGASSMTDRSQRLKMRNLRAEYYWRMREALDPEKGDNLALPPDPEILGDLCAPKYSLTASGVQIEEKDAIKARLGRSPDCGDAVVLALPVNHVQVWI